MSQVNTNRLTVLEVYDTDWLWTEWKVIMPWSMCQMFDRVCQW